MNFAILLNPFTRIAGFSALFYGCVIMLLTTAIAAPCGVNFVGSLNIHVAQPLPFILIFSLLILGWLTAASCFYIAGVFVSKSKIRAIDVFGTFALARAPFLIAALCGLLPGLVNLDPQQKQMPMEFWVFAAVALLVDIWVVVLSYNAFAVSTNVKSKWLFAAILVVSEIVAIVISGSLAVWILQNPVGRQPDNPAAVAVEPAVVPLPEDAEIVEIAEKFVRQVVERDTDAILHSYPMTNEFRAGMPNADTVREWARGIDQLFGRLGDISNSEIVEYPDLGLRSVYLYYQGTKHPAKIWVTFSGMTIDGFHYDVWAEGYTEGKPSREKFGWFAGWSLVVVVFVIVVLVQGVVGVILLLLFHKNTNLLVGVVVYSSLAIFALALALPVLLPATGEDDPTVEIVDGGINIIDGYGLKIDFSEITDFSLMENRISDIGITWKTFGYATSTTQKGYFRSNRHGSVLLFTKTNSSPTIHIKREGKADVFLNFSNNEATRALYNDMKTAFTR